MRRPVHHKLGRREREIMDSLFRRGEASVADVVQDLGGESLYDSVRVTLRNLEKKGYVTHRPEGQHYVYRATVQRDEARESAMTHLLKTFFDDSPSGAILALLEMSERDLSESELEEISARIEEAARQAHEDAERRQPEREG